MENSGSLRAIQVLAKIAKVLCMIIFVLCVIGAVFSILGTVALVAVKNVQVRGHALAELVESKAGVQYWVGVAGCGFAALCCILEAVVAKLSHNYFCREVEDGTPFTFGGAKQLMRLGITIIIIEFAIALGAFILTAVITKTNALNLEMLQAAAAKYSQEKVSPMDFKANVGFGSIGSYGVGIAFIIVSVIFRHGAELREAAEPEKPVITE